MTQNGIFAAVLAGGKGTRMGNVEKPKQFMELAGKPIIAHTIEKFAIHPELQAIIVLTPKQWVNHTKDIVRKYIPHHSHIFVIEGGVSRNDTVMNAIGFIENEFELTDDTIILTHDSVRPFVSHRIISENIAAAKIHSACNTVIPAVDTIVESMDGISITSIPDRAHMYQGQTPQTFHAKKLKQMYESLSEEEKVTLTDACKIMVLKKEEVFMIPGEVSNIKITYPYDIKVAEALLEGDE